MTCFFEISAGVVAKTFVAISAIRQKCTLEMACRRARAPLSTCRSRALSSQSLPRPRSHKNFHCSLVAMPMCDVSAASCGVRATEWALNSKLAARGRRAAPINRSARVAFRESADHRKSRGRTAKTSPATSISFPQDRRRPVCAQAAAEALTFAPAGTDAIVFRICDAIWYGSPWEFGRRSSR